MRRFRVGQPSVDFSLQAFSGAFRLGCHDLAIPLGEHDPVAFPDAGFVVAATGQIEVFLLRTALLDRAALVDEREECCRDGHAILGAQAYAPAQGSGGELGAVASQAGVLDEELHLGLCISLGLGIRRSLFCRNLFGCGLNRRFSATVIGQAVGIAVDQVLNGCNIKACLDHDLAGFQVGVFQRQVVAVAGDDLARPVEAFPLKPGLRPIFQYFGLDRRQVDHVAASLDKLRLEAFKDGVHGPGDALAPCLCGRGIGSAAVIDVDQEVVVHAARREAVIDDLFEATRRKLDDGAEIGLRAGLVGLNAALEPSPGRPHQRILKVPERLIPRIGHGPTVAGPVRHVFVATGRTLAAIDCGHIAVCGVNLGEVIVNRVPPFMGQ